MPPKGRRPGLTGLLLACAVFLLSASAYTQERRVVPAGADGPARRLALVIGNQAYARSPLRNPRADARAFEALLRQDLGFTDVQRVEDTKLLDMQRAVREFIRRVKPGDLALFYYSGHGMQMGGNNWMIPVDFKADFEDEVPDQAYAAQRVLKDLEEAGAAVRILILDACRDNPLPAAQKRSGKDGLATMNAGEGTYILFATAENRTADDNPRGNNGLFTSYLVEAMRKPGVTLDSAFKETRRLVAEASGNKQRPWLATDIDRDIVLRPGAAPAPPPPAGAPAAAAPAAPKFDAASEAWNLIKGSQRSEDFDEFARTFPASDLAGAAKLRADQLRRNSTPAPVQPPAGQSFSQPAQPAPRTVPVPSAVPPAPAQTGQPPVWRISINGALYRIESSGGILHIVPLAAGFAADLPIKSDRKGQPEIVGQWQSGVYRGFLQIQHMTDQLISGYMLVPQQGVNVNSCISRTAAALQAMADGMAKKQVASCQQVNVQWVRQ